MVCAAGWPGHRWSLCSPSGLHQWLNVGLAARRWAIDVAALKWAASVGSSYDNWPLGGCRWLAAGSLSVAG